MSSDYPMPVFQFRNTTMRSVGEIIDVLQDIETEVEASEFLEEYIKYLGNKDTALSNLNFMIGHVIGRNNHVGAKLQKLFRLEGLILGY